MLGFKNDPLIELEDLDVEKKTIGKLRISKAPFYYLLIFSLIYSGAINHSNVSGFASYLLTVLHVARPLR